MIIISGLRKENRGGWTRLVADISSDEKRYDSETTMWVAVKEENEYMLTTDVYNMFLFLPVYMSMYYHTDLCISGCVSKKLYRNIIDYVVPILNYFSDKLNPDINVIVDGFKECEGEHNVIGTGISCGVDCLATIYKYLEKESDPDYRLNALFMLNCGWHGDYGDENTFALFEERCEDNKRAADDMNLPLIMVDSNLHAFLPKLGDQASYFSLYTCAFAMETSLSRYYLSSSYSYREVMKYGHQSRNRDWSEFGDPMALPLMQTEGCQIVSDGCQYSRSEKTELIADWDISKKYLNVCCKNDSRENDSVCHKCARTLLPLEAMNKLDEYQGVFNIEKWNKISYEEKCKMVLASRTVAFAADNYQFCKERGMQLPTRLQARLHFLPMYFKRCVGIPKNLINRLLKR